MNELFDRTGKRITLGQKIGSGGEGAVYEVSNLESGFLAKIYKDVLVQEKQEKLFEMVQLCDEPLKKIAAWPLETLHSAINGPVCGFLMQKAVNCEPIHHLYSPSHRKQEFPKADWAFLVYAARNVAAAFEVIHGHGHVIGDVNPNLVFIARNGIVKLIDCDSFQVISNNKKYLCEVGVLHFTPSELQTHKPFRDVVRTINHDNFGLALIIFHILLMGRHPFSGVYSGSGDMPLEKAIENFCYAFSINAANKKMAPPPNCVTPSILPNSISKLFERAFSEQGAKENSRPTANEWVMALDDLRKNLKSCGQLSVHKYFNGLTNCPWCLQEQKNVFFFISLVAGEVRLNTFDINQIWNKILSVNSPGPVPRIDVPAFQSKMLSFLNFTSEHQRVKREIKVAEEQLEALILQWKKEVGDTQFQSIFNQLQRIREEYQNLVKNYSSEKQGLQNKIKENQLNKFLERYFIDDANIPGVGATRKATLASYGVETAADINRNRIMNIKGFGANLTGALTSWRNRIESKFVFDPSKGIDPRDISILNNKYAKSQKQLEISLVSGLNELTQTRDQILQRRNTLLPQINKLRDEVIKSHSAISSLQKSVPTPTPNQSPNQTNVVSNNNNSNKIIKNLQVSKNENINTLAWLTFFIITVIIVIISNRNNNHENGSINNNIPMNNKNENLEIKHPYKNTPSFSCDSAKLQVEKTICSDDGLREKDSDISKLYIEYLSSMKKDKKKLNAFKAEQRKWLKNIRNICKNIKCLDDAYTNRGEKLKIEMADYSKLIKQSKVNENTNSLNLGNAENKLNNYTTIKNDENKNSQNNATNNEDQNFNGQDNLHYNQPLKEYICNKGYVKQGDNCIKHNIPENSHINKYTNDFECDHGYRKKINECLKVLIPDNAKLNYFGNDWECNRGYRKQGDECLNIIIPNNAELNYLGNDWVCRKGYKKQDSECLDIVIPENAKLNYFGNDWECSRGYRKQSNECLNILVPRNAELNYLGNDWICGKGYRKQGNECI